MHIKAMRLAAVVRENNNRRMWNGGGIFGKRANPVLSACSQLRFAICNNMDQCVVAIFFVGNNQLMKMSTDIIAEIDSVRALLNKLFWNAVVDHLQIMVSIMICELCALNHGPAAEGCGHVDICGGESRGVRAKWECEKSIFSLHAVV
jgi:hypothetical protein